VRLGLQRVFPASALQQLARQVHQVHVLQQLLLAEQVHLPLALSEPAQQVRAAGRGQFQLVAPAHEAVR